MTITDKVRKKVDYILENSLDLIIEGVRENLLHHYVYGYCECEYCKISTTIAFKEQELEDCDLRISMLDEESEVALGERLVRIRDNRRVVAKERAQISTDLYFLRYKLKYTLKCYKHGEG